MGYPEQDLIAASATPLLRAILQKGPSDGHAIIQAVGDLSGGPLDDQGRIEAYDHAGDTGRKRRYHHRLRRDGRRALEAEPRLGNIVSAMLAKVRAT